MLDKCLKYSTFFNCFFYHVLCWGWLLLDPFYISIFLYSFQFQTISVIVLMMHCTTDPSFTSSTKSSAYYTVRNSFLAIWKSLNFQQHSNKILFVQFIYNRPTRHCYVLFLKIRLHAGLHTEKDR